MKRLGCLRVKNLVLALTIFAGPVTVHGGDWPQILGPARNGVAVDEPAIAAWSSNGIHPVWTYPVGQGYAGPAVVGQRVLILHRVGDTEQLDALDVATGKALWSSRFPASYAGGIDPDNGPRSVPTVHEQRVFVFGAAGDLHCVSLDTGSTQWSRPLAVEFAAREGYFGFGSSPIVEGDRLLVNVGGAKGGIVALDIRDGKTIWKATNEDASYSSPTSTRLGDKPCVVFVTRLSTVGLDPANGAIRFQFPFGKRGPTVNAATPLVVDGCLFLSASYQIGADLRELATNGLTPVWANDETMSSQYSTCVFQDGYLYGFHGREDVGEVELRCFEARTAKIAWRKTDIRPGHLLLVNDQLLILTSDGQLILAPATARGFKPSCSASVSADVTRAIPAFSRGRLYFRDNSRSGNGTLCCLRLAPGRD